MAIAHSSPIPDSPPEPYNAPSYAFKYNVDDGPYGPIFSHGENRENYKAEGEYQVNLPDGRVATVTYKVDGPTGGFVADVKFDGVSVYPDAPPAAYHPAPAPAYAPAPAEPAAEEPAPEAAPEPAAPVYKPAPGKFIYQAY